ncbi:MAG: STAS domain-containing protein [Candidatus Omnitrophota bacterium]|jgi:anti-sigma B factor antagonist
MRISQKEIDGITTYEISGDIDINSSPEVREFFEKGLKGKMMKVLVNLSGVPYVDSSGLATLVEMLKKTRSYGGRLRISNLAPKVKSLFEITKLEKLFEIFDAAEDAISGF